MEEVIKKANWVFTSVDSVVEKKQYTSVGVSYSGMMRSGESAQKFIDNVSITGESEVHPNLSAISRLSKNSASLGSRVYNNSSEFHGLYGQISINSQYSNPLPTLDIQLGNKFGQELSGPMSFKVDPHVGIRISRSNTSPYIGLSTEFCFEF